MNPLSGLNRSQQTAVLVAFICTSALLSPSHAADPFAENIRTTPALTPEEEQKLLKVPAGFAVQLVAAEPQISKPMNLAFDSRGRLWVTESMEYPIPAPNTRKGRDAIKVLEDLDGDGRMDKVTTFADGLNIPIGLLPYKNGVIAWSIPNISYFEDTDNDGKSDKQTILFGPLGWERDTHGNQNNFRRGFDGWIYACHGFNNESTFVARDGSKIHLVSGNTYRFLPDARTVEQYTYGQVNPFGLTQDPWGNFYTSDCHSSPLYQLIPGGDYPSFGKVPAGLGFAPVMVQHTHDSTAIAGIAGYFDNQFPEAWHGDFFVGNVMTSRINHDRIVDVGATKIGKEAEDLLVSEDPWFRPVDTQLGPDGALYIADFYNRIIGHYEVALTHPGRDRASGRIWRVVALDEKGKPKVHVRKKPLSELSLSDLWKAFNDANHPYRMLALQETIDRLGEDAVKPVQKWISKKETTPSQKIHGLWILQRLQGMTDPLWKTLVTDMDPMVRVHTIRAMAQETKLVTAQRGQVARALTDKNSWVQRAATETLARHPEAGTHIRSLIDRIHQVPSADKQLAYSAKLALKQQLRQPGSFASIGRSFTARDRAIINEVILAVPTPEAASFLMKELQASPEMDPGQLTEQVKHLASHLPADEIPQLAALVQKQFSREVDLQNELFKSILNGFQTRGQQPPALLREWGAKLAEELLTSGQENNDWGNTPLENSPTPNPWVVASRTSADNRTGLFFTSLPHGEQQTGILRSKVFPIPPSLKFFMAGHRGVPDMPAHNKNAIRLRLADSNEAVAESYPPRNDLAQPIEWDLSAHEGQKGYLEVIDGDTTPQGFAWLAVGRFTPEVATFPKVGPAQVAARIVAGADLAARFSLRSLEDRLALLLQEKSTDVEARGALARSLLTLNPQGYSTTFSNILHDTSLPLPVREKVAQGLIETQNANALDMVVGAIKQASSKSQIRLAQVLASHPQASRKLVRLCGTGELSPRLLQDRGVQDRINSSWPGGRKQLLEIISKLTPLDEEVQKAIDRRRSEFSLVGADAAVGGKIFSQTCAACHRIGTVGGLIGPQLDGLKGRGLDRIVEDLVDPNRNVDHAFRTSLITLKDGEVITGLFRREEGESMILADGTGKEISISKATIATRRESETSLMPEGLAEQLSREDFNHLLAYLMQ